MKELTCEIIRDLIPLCAEGLCSEASKQAVETHIASCAACRRLYDEPPEEAAPVIVPGADAAMQRVNRSSRSFGSRSVLYWWTALSTFWPVRRFFSSQVRMGRPLTNSARSRDFFVASAE